MNKESILKIKHLLEKISLIKKKYDEIARIRGDYYNVFNIIGVEYVETFHSRFIADLLNPKGLHGQGNVFLNLFLEQQKIYFFDKDTAVVEREFHISTISKNWTEGGNIDIIIRDKSGNAIIIENKIWAKDQYQQLERYYNYGKKLNGKFELFYLTLDGHKPSDNSIGELKEGDYKLISYRNDILNWLIKCKKETVNYPLLRETLTQYINLIKQITNQTMDEKMKEEMRTEFIESFGLKENTEDNLMRLNELKNQIEMLSSLVTDEIEKEENVYIKKWTEKLKKDFGNKYDIINNNRRFGGDKLAGIKLEYKSIPFAIISQIENGQVFYGVCVYGNKKNNEVENFVKSFLKSNFNPNDVWYGFDVSDINSAYENLKRLILYYEEFVNKHKR